MLLVLLGSNHLLLLLGSEHLLLLLDLLLLVLEHLHLLEVQYLLMRHLWLLERSYAWYLFLDKILTSRLVKLLFVTLRHNI